MNLSKDSANFCERRATLQEVEKDRVVLFLFVNRGSMKLSTVVAPFRCSLHFF